MAILGCAWISVSLPLTRHPEDLGGGKLRGPYMIWETYHLERPCHRPVRPRRSFDRGNPMPTEILGSALLSWRSNDAGDHVFGRTQHHNGKSYDRGMPVSAIGLPREVRQTLPCQVVERNAGPPDYEVEWLNGGEGPRWKIHDAPERPGLPAMGLSTRVCSQTYA